MVSKDLDLDIYSMQMQTLCLTRRLSLALHYCPSLVLKAAVTANPQTLRTSQKASRISGPIAIESVNATLDNCFLWFWPLLNARYALETGRGPSTLLLATGSVLTRFSRTRGASFDLSAGSPISTPRVDILQSSARDRFDSTCLPLWVFL